MEKRKITYYYDAEAGERAGLIAFFLGVIYYIFAFAWSIGLILGLIWLATHVAL